MLNYIGPTWMIVIAGADFAIKEVMVKINSHKSVCEGHNSSLNQVCLVGMIVIKG